MPRPVYETEIWEADDGWHWAVEINGSKPEFPDDSLADHRVWNGVVESRVGAFNEVIDKLGLIEGLLSR